ncbi:MAG: hypothetical protein MUE99_08200 [Chitinophagaceae bacterium]|jgi:hypothetical protein|nr:hypothetical protein [Chitinophagaceae bacterium]
MIELIKNEIKGTEAVKQLRIKKLKSGHPFMINSNDIGTDHCYLEFPDGTIKLAKIESSARDYYIIRDLTPAEAEKLRKRFDFAH